MPDFSLLSWNIAQAQPSHAAPKHWKETDSTENRETLQNTIRSYNPDILALQEIPNPNWLPMLISFESYIPLGCAQSHCGYTTLLMRPTLVKNVNNVFQVGPSIIAFWKQGNKNISISSSHLYPGKNGAIERHTQFKALWECAQSHSATHTIMAGDMNMRRNEDREIESLAIPPLKDIWKQHGTKKNQWTWNTKINRYHPQQFPCTARFDRIYHTSNVEPKTLTLVGANPLSNPHHFASDHFGLCARMMITQ